MMELKVNYQLKLELVSGSITFSIFVGDMINCVLITEKAANLDLIHENLFPCNLTEKK